MKNKRGQITIFILLGVVILAAVGFILYTKSETIRITDEFTDIPLEIQPIKSFVDSCIKQTLERGIYFISLQGGYYDVPEPKTEGLIIQIPYYFYLGQNKFPQKENIERELSDYIEDNILACINDFETFKQLGYEFETTGLSVNSFIDKTISVDVIFPIVIKKGDSVTKIENFISEVDFDFKRIYNTLSNFSLEHQKNPDYVPIGYLPIFSFKNNIISDVVYQNDNSVIYTFVFQNISNEKELLFNFASKYNWENSSKTTNLIEIEPIPSQMAYPDYEFEYQVNVNGGNAKFTDYTELFDISDDGMIVFTPDREYIGNHSVMIKAYNDEGDENLAVFNLNIIGDNNPPIIQNIEDQEINVGTTFNYKVNAFDPENDIIFYSIESSLTNLTVDTLFGIVDFTPKPIDKGNYTISVIAIDVNGAIAKEYFDLIIKDE